MIACPNCGSVHFGTDVIYARGAAKFCQDCLLRGPRVPIDTTTENWLAQAEIEAEAEWDQAAQAAKPIGDTDYTLSA